jgi:hypothetical protein
VFLSYSHADAAFAGRLASDLEANIVDVWQDVKSIATGDSITTAIEGALQNCAAVLLLLSASAVASPWVQREYRAALSLQQGAPGRMPRVVPCVLTDCEIPTFLRDILYADFRTNYESGFGAVARGLGIEHPRIPSLTLKADIEALLKKVEAACKSLEQKRHYVVSHESFDEWTPIEDELQRLVAAEAHLSRRKRMVRSRYEVANQKDALGRPYLDGEPWPMNSFLVDAANIAEEVIQLAERYGVETGRPSVMLETYRRIGGTGASN